MNKGIQDYLLVFNNALSNDICNKAITELEKNSWEQHTYHDPSVNDHTSVNGDRELDISNSNLEVTSIIMETVGSYLQKYIDELDFPWFNSLSGYTGIRFNRYKRNALMSEHCDHIYTMFDGERRGIPVLSILGILNDNYSGGELVFWKDTTIQTKAGDILIWPSNFMYPHKVQPVTQGQRYSFVSWAW